jgi:UDP-N-acetylmuramoyl-tripeptide--D-alanyl-D-alanine ligase
MSAPAPARRPLEAAVAAMGGVVLGGGKPALGGRSYAGAATDNRQVTPGRLFFALKGERVDGFDFCAAAAAAGAAALVVPSARGVPAGVDDRVPVIGVPDPRAALAQLARAVRAAFAGRVVGITGSNGKTTTKELVAAALGPPAARAGDGAGGGARGAGGVLKTAGNLNTDVGLPLTVLEATGEEAFWVLEMAMRARGEIAYLADIAAPHVGLVTNVAAAHLGRLGSLAEVARAKGEIFSGLADGGVGVLPADEPLLEAEAAHLAEARKRRFGGVGTVAGGGIEARIDARILDYVAAGARGSVIRLAVGDEPVVVRLPLAGEHNARNAAAALAVVLALGRPARAAAAAMERVTLPEHRSRILRAGPVTVLDDCYNANPASMAAALRTLAAAAAGSGRAFAVVGDMLELGHDGEGMHREVGALAARLGLAGLAAVGPLAAAAADGARAAGLDPARVVATEDPAQAAAAVWGWARGGDWVLVKASRGLRLERVVDALLARGGGGNGDGEAEPEAGAGKAPAGATAPAG